jgi:hypothetical protein
MEKVAQIIINLLKLITSNKSKSEDIIEFMTINNINPNIYLPMMNGKGEMPILYYCCSNLKYEMLFNYLVNMNVDVSLEMKIDVDNLFNSNELNNSNESIELLYYSQLEYIPFLIKLGCRINEGKFIENGEKLLIGGNVNKLMLLYKHGAISKDNLISLINKENILTNILERLYERVFFICRNKDMTNEIYFKKNLSETMINYSNVFRLFLNNGIILTSTFIQMLLNTYFIEIIELVLNFNNSNYDLDNDNINFLHYSNFDITNRQIMSIYYNNENYERINSLITQYKLPKKVIVKKPMKLHGKKIIN